jgi:hypothetical protein
MAHEAHELDVTPARQPRDRGVLGAVLEEPCQGGGLLADLAQQQRVGDVLGLRSRLGHRAARHPLPSRAMNTGVEPVRSRRLSSETRR